MSSSSIIWIYRYSKRVIKITTPAQPPFTPSSCSKSSCSPIQRNDHFAPDRTRLQREHPLHGTQWRLSPDHSTLAHFVSSMQQEIESIFANILLVCDQLDLLGGSHFSLDGVKLPSNASKEWSGTFKELKRNGRSCRPNSSRSSPNTSIRMGYPTPKQKEARYNGSVCNIRWNA